MDSTFRTHTLFLCRRAISVILLNFGLFLVSATLGASTITVNFTNLPNPLYVDRTVDTGQFQFTTVSGDTSKLSGIFYSFCIEPREFISQGQTVTYTESPLQDGTTNIGGMGAAKAALLEELFGRYDPNVNTPLDALHASAMQIAIWEIVRETSGTLDVYSGTTRFANPQGTLETQALALAETYVQSLNGKGPMDTKVFALTNDGVQDMIVQANAPEPSTYGMMGMGLMAVGWLGGRLRRRRRGAA